MFQPKPVRKLILSKAIKAIRLLTSILKVWVLDHEFSKRLKPKNASFQTCQQTKCLKSYKGHKAPNIYPKGVGAGP